MVAQQSRDVLDRLIKDQVSVHFSDLLEALTCYVDEREVIRLVFHQLFKCT